MHRLYDDDKAYLFDECIQSILYIFIDIVYRDNYVAYN